MITIRKFIMFVLCVVMAGIVFAGGPTSTTIWGPDHNNHVQLMSDDGLTPTTFYMDCKVNITDSLIMDKLVAQKQIFHAPVVASSVGVYAVNITTETLNAKTTVWAETMMKVFLPARTVGASMSMTALTGLNGVFQASNTVYGTVEFKGYDAKGQYIVETVVSSLCATINYTSQAFARITQVTCSAITHVGLDSQRIWTRLTINLATGNKLGICGDIQTIDDVFQVIEGTQPIRTSDTNILSIDYTYDTVDFLTDETQSVNPKEITYLTGSYRP